MRLVGGGANATPVLPFRDASESRSSKAKRHTAERLQTGRPMTHWGCDFEERRLISSEAVKQPQRRYTSTHVVLEPSANPVQARGSPLTSLGCDNNDQILMRKVWQSPGQSAALATAASDRTKQPVDPLLLRTYRQVAHTGSTPIQY